MGLVHRRSARGTVRPARHAGVRGRPQSRRARRVDRPASMSSDRWRKTRPEEQRAIALHAANLRAAAVGTRGLVRSFAVAALRKMLANPFDRVRLSYDGTWRKLAMALNLHLQHSTASVGVACRRREADPGGARGRPSRWPARRRVVLGGRRSVRCACAETSSEEEEGP